MIHFSSNISNVSFFAIASFKRHKSTLKQDYHLWLGNVLNANIAVSRLASYLTLKS